MTEKAAAIGFDWRKPADVMAKMREEMDELENELDDGNGAASVRAREEMGDVLFVMANLARHLKVEPETALQRTNTTFKRRFESMETQARERGTNLREMSLEEQDTLWEEAKRLEGKPSSGSAIALADDLSEFRPLSDRDRGFPLPFDGLLEQPPVDGDEIRNHADHPHLDTRR